MLCKEMTGKITTQSCTKRNIVYETWCQRCKDDDEKKAEEEGRDKSKVKIWKYIEESAKSAFERGFEHVSDMRSLSLKSHMLKLWIGMSDRTTITLKLE